MQQLALFNDTAAFPEHNPKVWQHYFDWHKSLINWLHCNIGHIAKVLHHKKKVP